MRRVQFIGKSEKFFGEEGIKFIKAKVLEQFQKFVETSTVNNWRGYIISTLISFALK